MLDYWCYFNVVHPQSATNNTQRNLRRSGSTKGYVIWCGYNIMGGDYTKQYINCRGIVIFVPDDLAHGRGGIWIINNNIQ